MNIRFTPQAKADLDGFVAYHAEIGSTAFPRILADIMRTLEYIRAHPHVGIMQTHVPIRKCVTSKYRNLIYYRSNEEIGCIDIVRISHARQQRPFEDG